MKNYICTLVTVFMLSFAASLPLCAQMQSSVFADYSHYVDKAMGISWKMPRGFVDLKQGNIPWGPGVRKSGGNIGIGYEAVLQSKDGNCLILYPNMDLMLFTVQAKENDMIRKMLVGEMNAALNLQDKSGNEKSAAFEFGKYVKTLHGDEAWKYFRADTIFIADIPLQGAFREKYVSCIGLYVVKTGCPPMMLKCFFTEAGEKQEEKYLKSLYRSVKYKNDDWVYDDAKVTKERYKLYLKRR